MGAVRSPGSATSSRSTTTPSRPCEVGKRIVYDVKANWKLIVENFMECYHCATIHPELTEVLPEFADGFAAQYFVGHGAVFGDDVKGFTVDGSEGVEKIPGVTDDQDRRYYAVTIRPNVFVNLVPDHVIFHRMFPHRARPHHRRMRLAVPAGGHRLRRRPGEVDRAVRPGQPAGLRGLRAVPVGHRLPDVQQRRRAGAQRAPHRRLPELDGRRHRRLTSAPVAEAGLSRQDRLTSSCTSPPGLLIQSPQRKELLVPQQVQAVISRAKDAPVELVTITVPDPGPGEAVVQVQACGVCHTDLHYVQGGIGDDYPYLLGHEAAGIVESVGDGVRDLEPGRLRHPELAGRLRHLPGLQAGPAVVLLRHLQRHPEDDPGGRHRAVTRRWGSARSSRRPWSPPVSAPRSTRPPPPRSPACSAAA